MKIRSKLLIFIILSLGVHAILFIAVPKNKVELPASAGNMLTINITEKVTTFSSTSKQKNITQKESTPEKYKGKTATSPERQKTSSEKKQQPDKKLQKQQARKNIKTPAKQSIVNTAQSQAKILSLLKTRLSQNFYYPKLAQRRNWQGNVLLEFDVNSNGNIKNIEVKQSSGYTILDNAAINSLSKVSGLSNNEILATYYSGLKLNVKYRLEEG